MDEYKRRRRSRAVMSMFLDSLGGSIDNVDVAEFDSDGSDLKDLIVGIEPIQDLHGYDSPWPSGGGVNLLPPHSSPSITSEGVTLTNNNGEYTLNGTTGSNVAVFDVNVDLPAGQYTVALNNPTVNSKVQIYGIDENVAVPLQVYCSTVNTTATATFAATVKKFRICVLANGTVDNFKLSPVFSAGATAATKFYPYSNICPIYGHTDADVVRTGKNLANVTPTLDGNRYVTFFGNHSASNATTGIFLKAGTYTLSVANPQGANVGVYGCYLDDHAQITISGNGTQTTKTGTLTLSKDRTLNFWLYFDTVGTNYTDGITVQIELGSTASAYSPYVGTTYPIPLGQTVYGGTLDVLTGVLTVDWASILLNEFSFDGTSSPERHIFRATYRNIIPNVKVPESDEKSWDALCSSYGYKPYAPISATDDGKYAIAIDVDRIVFIDHRCNTVNEFEQLNASVQLVYPLATPTTIQLTGQQIPTFLGTNHVWCDSGRIIHLEY